MDNSEIQKYHYFIAYLHQVNSLQQGYGNCDVYRNKPITSYDDIKEIQERIREKNGVEQVIIVNYQRL